MMDIWNPEVGLRSLLPATRTHRHCVSLFPGNQFCIITDFKSLEFFLYILKVVSSVYLPRTIMLFAVHAGDTPLVGTFMFVAYISCRFMEPFSDGFIGQPFLFECLIHYPSHIDTMLVRDLPQRSNNVPETCKLTGTDEVYRLVSQLIVLDCTS